MPKCSLCGAPIKIDENTIHSGRGDLFYHLSCAPDDLLRDVVIEGNAILTRGVIYYVNKYLPDKLRASTWPREGKKSFSEEDLVWYADMFAKMLRSYRSERTKRKSQPTHATA